MRTDEEMLMLLNGLSMFTSTWTLDIINIARARARGMVTQRELGGEEAPCLDEE
jgi:hypothetical protein